MSLAPRSARLGPADVEAWLAELRATPLERGGREGVTSPDLVLDGRRRAGMPFVARYSTELAELLAHADGAAE